MSIFFRRSPISFARAALGGPIRIKTVDGEVEYEVKPGTQTDFEGQSCAARAFRAPQQE
jgi:DnaJ-class molecular chaperone